MSPNYNFPSQIKVDLSEIEKPLRRKKTVYDALDFVDFLLITFIVVSVLILGFLIERTVIDPLLNAPVAHAEANEEIHQNDYYCNRIKHEGVHVLNPEGDLTKLCAEWGVTL